MTRAWLVVGTIVAVVGLLSGCSGPSGPNTSTVTFAGLDPDQDGYITAEGIISGVAEDGGKCSFTFWAVSGAASRLTGDGVAMGDHTACGPVSEEVRLLISGGYQVELEYEALSGDSVVSERVPMTLPTSDNVNP